MKQSGLLRREIDAYNKGLRDGYRFMRQLMCDFFCIVLNKHGYGYARINAMLDELMEMHDEFADIYNNDSRDQEYSHAALDRTLQQIAGEHFVPWNERYG